MAFSFFPGQEFIQQEWTFTVKSDPAFDQVFQFSDIARPGVLQEFSGPFPNAGWEAA